MKPKIISLFSSGINVGKSSFDNDTYQCAVCKQIFIKELTEEEAEKQLEEEFPGVDKNDCDIVCDDCYNKIWGKNDA